MGHGTAKYSPDFHGKYPMKISLILLENPGKEALKCHKYLLNKKKEEKRLDFHGF